LCSHLAVAEFRELGGEAKGPALQNGSFLAVAEFRELGESTLKLTLSQNHDSFIINISVILPILGLGNETSSDGIIPDIIPLL